MPSKQLMAVWGLLDFLLLAAGGGIIAFSIILRAPDALRNLILTDFDLNCAYPLCLLLFTLLTEPGCRLPVGLVLGILYVATFVISVGAIIQQNHVTIGLAILNWILIANVVVTSVFGANLWFMTLRENENFGNVWNNITPERRIGVQDLLECCGFANNTAIESGGFCADPAVTLNNGCEVKFVGFADNMLMDAFTYVLVILLHIS
jgi:hypothetical protein